MSPAVLVLNAPAVPAVKPHVYQRIPPAAVTWIPRAICGKLGQDRGQPAIVYGHGLRSPPISPTTLTAPCNWVGRPEQVTAGVPGWLARLRSIVLTEVLTEAGDLPAADAPQR
jgi:hypothetical protein